VNSQDKMNAAGEQLLERIKVALKDEQGVQVESLLTCLGALAGYACQASVLHTVPLVSATTADGFTYLYGDALNAPLAESPLSVWAFIGKAVQKAGAPLPDLAEIFKHVTQTIGSKAFGVPRTPDENRPRDLPLVYIQQLWPQALPIAQRFCEKRAQLPIVFAIALQRALEQARGVIDMTLAARIAMESAVAMSKVVLPEANPTPPKARPQPGRQSIAQQQEQVLARLPRGVRTATIVVLAIIGVAAAIWRTGHEPQPTPERDPRAFDEQKWNESLRELERATEQARAQKARAAEDLRNAASQASPPPGFDEKVFKKVRLPDGREVTVLRDEAPAAQRQGDR
jgi:hypothetical protein